MFNGPGGFGPSNLSPNNMLPAQFQGLQQLGNPLFQQSTFGMLPNQFQQLQQFAPQTTYGNQYQYGAQYGGGYPQQYTYGAGFPNNYAQQQYPNEVYGNHGYEYGAHDYQDEFWRGIINEQLFGPGSFYGSSQGHYPHGGRYYGKSAKEVAKTLETATNKKY